MKLSNHKPGVLLPKFLQTKPNNQLDVYEPVKALVEDALFQPLTPNAPATITDNGNPVTPDGVTDALLACIGTGVVDQNLEASLKDVLHHGLVHYDKAAPLLVDEMFAVQAGAAEQLPWPTPVAVYTPKTDIIPTAKELLAGMCSFDKWFATLHFYARSTTLAASFADADAFERFQNWFQTQTTQFAHLLPTDTVKLINSFMKLDLKELTTSINLRKDQTDGLDEWSFPRLIQWALFEYCNVETPPLYGILPFSLAQALVPETLVFVNVTEHANAPARKIADEWKFIQQALASPVRIVSNKRLSQMTAGVRAAQTLKQSAADNRRDTSFEKAARVRFRKTAPTVVDFTRYVKRISEKMGNVARSQNVTRTITTTYQKANRRNPDDYNLPGKSTITSYRPDIHLYLDTSGSINERHYQDAVKACIKLAQKLNVNLYFNSFSTVLSQCTLIQVRGRSAAQIYRQFQKIPKVSGGTSFSQIWDYIEQSEKRKKELSIIVTDFLWTPPSRFVKHPKNLYYTPCSNMDWQFMCDSAERYAQKMQHIDPSIRARLLM